MTENHLQQVMLPRGCTVLQNDWGTAPACAFEADGCMVIMLPGPPSELIPMLKNYAIPYLTGSMHAAIVSKIVRVFGLGEGNVAEQIPDLTDGANPTAAKIGRAHV